MPISKARQEANNRYLKKAYFQLAIRLPKSAQYKERIQEAAEAAGISSTEFVRRAIDKALEG